MGMRDGSSWVVRAVVIFGLVMALGCGDKKNKGPSSHAADGGKGGKGGETDAGSDTKQDGGSGRPMQDYDYGYRQGTLADPFGHLWLIQRRC